MAANSDVDFREELEKLQKGDETNRFCFDCGKESPEFASVNLGVFVCYECATVHKRLGNAISQVKSLRIDTWTEEMFRAMQDSGNAIGRQHWESKLPPVWPKPNPSCRPVCREQWIRAKYERKEFVPSAPEILRPYLTGLRQGYLFKRKKGSDEYQKRYFVLNKDNFSYYINPQDKKPKASIPLLSINVMFDAPCLSENPFSILINYLTYGKSRSIFVYAESGHEIMDWFLAIRTAKLKLIKSRFPEKSDEELLHLVTWEPSMSGYLYKMPPNMKKFQKRYFLLDKQQLKYYEKPTDPFPLGEIALGTSAQGFGITDVVPKHLSGQEFVFMLKVPSRSGGGFPLMAETDQSKKQWMAALQASINGTSLLYIQSDATKDFVYDNEDDSP